MEIAERAVEKMNRIDAEWLRNFDEATLVYFAIDHADAGKAYENVNSPTSFLRSQLAIGDIYDSLSSPA